MEIANLENQFNEKEMTKKEVLEWKGEGGVNIFHITALQKDDSQFKFFSSLLSTEEFKQKMNEKNDLGDCPAHTATWAGKNTILEEIALKIGTLDYIDANSRNVPMIALKIKNKDCIELGLQYTTDMNHLDKYKQNLLHYAQQFSTAKIYKKIKSLGTNETTESSLGKKPKSPVEQPEESILDFVSTHKKRLASI